MHAGFQGGGADRKAAAEGNADQGHVVEVECIEDGRDRPMPIPYHWSVLFCEHGTLSGPFKTDDIPALVA